MRGLEGKRIIVAGSVSGIRAATARRLHAEGAKVLLGDINPEGLADGESVGGLDGIANIAADVSPATFVGDKNVLETDDSLWQHVLNVNAVASAGELAVPLLESYSSGGVSVAAASVRALSLIGGDNALQALTAYRSDPRVTVARQLIRAWSSFDTTEYAKRILAHSPLDRGVITLSDPDQVAQLPLLTKAEGAYVSFPRRFVMVADIPILPPKVYGADVSGLSDVISPAGLPFPRSMTSLSIRNSSLRTLDGVEQFDSLRYLSVSGSSGLEDVSALRSSTTLRYLDLSGTGIRELRLGDSASLEAGVAAAILRACAGRDTGAG